MKKILLLMAIILPFVLTSCEDKDEPKYVEEDLVGEWLSTLALQEDYYIFNSDHTGYMNIRTTKPRITIKDAFFTWELEGNTLTLTYINGEQSKFNISIKKDVLTIKTETYDRCFYRINNE